MTAGSINTSTAGRSAAQSTSKFLTFCLGREEYGVEILAVREIIGIIDITPLPQTPAYVKGVINLRGKIIPVIELRAKFGLESVAYTEETCVIVVETQGGNGDTFQMGVIVDAVREVLDVDRGSIEPAPAFGCELPLDYILGMGKVKEKVIILLNITNVLTAGDVDTLNSALTAKEQGPETLKTAA